MPFNFLLLMAFVQYFVRQYFVTNRTKKIPFYLTRVAASVELAVGELLSSRVVGSSTSSGSGGRSLRSASSSRSTRLLSSRTPRRSRPSSWWPCWELNSTSTCCSPCWTPPRSSRSLAHPVPYAPPACASTGRLRTTSSLSSRYLRWLQDSLYVGRVSYWITCVTSTILCLVEL